MTTRDTKDGIADLIVELISANRAVNLIALKEEKKLIYNLFQQTDTNLLSSLRAIEKVNQQGVEIVTDSQLVDIHHKIIRFLFYEKWKKDDYKIVYFVQFNFVF